MTRTAPVLVSALVIAAVLLLFGVTGCAILRGGTNPVTPDPARPYDGTRTATAVEKTSTTLSMTPSSRPGSPFPAGTGQAKTE
ncbi:hypothetical protein AB4Z38_09545 [Arthrobacter sp. 2RAF6]|uniref:hypothetical protein n=1 Tax=Arthrobacter sp. 2RAF6 TaxID=3233002 RepID=UPI003F8F5956